jgi:hypothetical protein
VVRICDVLEELHFTPMKTLLKITHEKENNSMGLLGEDKTEPSNTTQGDGINWPVKLVRQRNDHISHCYNEDWTLLTHEQLGEVERRANSYASLRKQVQEAAFILKYALPFVEAEVGAKLCSSNGGPQAIKDWLATHQQSKPQDFAAMKKTGGDLQ